MKKVVPLQYKSSVEREAAEWLIRLDAEEPLSALERDDFSSWLKQSPAHLREVRSLAKFWDALNILAPWLDIEQADQMGNKNLSGWKWAVTIFLIVGVCGGGLSLWLWGDTGRMNGYYATAVGQQRHLILTDGSKMLLNTNTQIKVDFSEDYRDIYLFQGEGHFSVAKNAKKPFRVFAGGGLIRAVGTAFSVCKNKNTVEVIVTKGRVALVASDDNQVIGSDAAKRNSVMEVVDVGQVASITKREIDGQENIAIEALRSIKASDLRNRMSWTEGILIFSGEPLEEVVQRISRYTPVVIEIEDPKIKTIRIGGRFPVGETEAMFNSLEKYFGLKVTRLGHDRVLLSANEY